MIILHISCVYEIILKIFVIVYAFLYDKNNERIGRIYIFAA